MSKKILAMFLAVLMVVSMLPASVLAAENDCPIAKGQHNLDNCTDYSVKKVVEATCTAGGYTLYECNACGDTFMGKPTPMLEHEKSSIVEAAKEPTFTEEGNVIKYHCDVCNKDWWEKEPHTIAPLNKAAADTLFDCDEGGKCKFIWENDSKACATGGMIATCVNCDRKIVSKANHEIDYTKVEIVTNPTATANGEAKAPCKVCGEEATIVIYPNHDHVYEDKSTDTLEPVAEDYDCVTGGTIAHLQCVICGKLFLEEEGKLVEKTLADLKGEPQEDGEHTVGTVDEDKSKDATCSVDGKLVYTCSVCRKNVEEVVPAGHLYGDAGTNVVVEMTCGQDGITVLTCQRAGCGLVTTVTETATKHTTLAEYQAAFAAIGNTIDAEALKELKKLDSENKLPYNKACYELLDGELTGFLKPVANSAVCEDEDGGEFSWNCLNCGKVQKAASPELDHNLVEYTVPATCAAVSYTFKYCTNANCPLTASATVKDADDNVYSAVVKTQVEVIKAIYDEEDENVLIGYAKVMEDVVIAAPKVSGKITAFGTTFDSNSHNYDEVTKVEPTCTTVGNYYKKCADCGNVEKSNPAATGHTWITNYEYSVENKRPVRVEPTCSTEGKITYKCKDCDKTKDEKIDKVAVWEYTSLEAAQAAHKKDGAAALTFVKKQIGTCKQFGYEEYTCDGCKHTIIISDGLTGAGHVDTLEETLTEAGTATFKAFNNGGYIVTINAISNGAAATGKIPMGGFTVNGKKIEEFGVAVNVPYVADAALVFALVEKNFSNDTEDRDEDEAIYSFESYTITVNYYTVQDPTCLEVDGKQGQDGKIIAHNCINEWCDTDLTTDGKQVYQYADKKINKLSHNYVTVKEAVTGVCGEIEARAEIVCSVCGDTKDLLKSDGTVDVADYYDGDPVHADKELENVTVWDIDEAICKNEKPVYDIYWCAECETYHIRNFKDVVPHTWDNGVILEGDEATCGSDGTKTFTCTVPGCGATKEETIPATAHKNSDGEFFTDHCNDTETNRHCVVCCSRPGKTDCATKKTSGVYDCAGMIGKNHSGSFETNKVWNPATCTAPGYWMFVCEYCDGAEKDGLVIDIPEKNPDDEKNEAIDHVAPAYSTSGMTAAEAILYAEKYTEVDDKAYLNYVAPTVLADGVEKFECANCGAVVERKLNRLENLHFSLNASNAVAPECGEFAEFSLVALTIKASGIDATLAGFNMTVEVDGGAAFVGYKWAENTPFLGSVTPAQKVEDEINIVGRVIGSSEIPVEDEVLVTLYFRVIGDTDFSFKGDVYAVNAVEEIKSSAQGTEIEVITLGDVNGDDEAFGNSVLDDLQAAINIFMGVEGAESYNVAADLNRNGEIDLQDLQLLCNLASIIATIDVDSGNLSDDDMKTVVEIFVDLLLLNPYEGELELYGICTECHELEELFGHDKECSKYVKRI